MPNNNTLTIGEKVTVALNILAMPQPGKPLAAPGETVPFDAQTELRDIAASFLVEALLKEEVQTEVSA